MKAAVLQTVNEPLRFEERKDPTPEHFETVVRVESTGLCHSDLHVWEGHYGPIGIDKMGVKLPLILGHEIAGSVESVGPEVTGVGVGDKVVVYPWIGDGTCKVCLSGDEQYCSSIRPLGLSRDGGFAEKVLVPHQRYLTKVKDIPLDIAAPLSCAGITAYSSVKRALPKPDDFLLIFGIGGLGHLAVQLASTLFHPTIIAVDTKKEALDLALELGADHVVNAATQNLSEELKRITRGSRVDAAIDFVGLSDTTLSAFKSLRRGGRLILTGLSGDYPKFLLPDIPVKAATISGTYVGNMKDIAELVELARRGYVKPRITAMSFDEINEAVKMMKEKRIVGRIILHP